MARIRQRSPIDSEQSTQSSSCPRRHKRKSCWRCKSCKQYAKLMRITEDLDEQRSCSGFWTFIRWTVLIAITSVGIGLCYALSNREEVCALLTEDSIDAE